MTIVFYALRLQKGKRNEDIKIAQREVISLFQWLLAKDYSLRPPVRATQKVPSTNFTLRPQGSPTFLPL